LVVADLLVRRSRHWRRLDFQPKLRSSCAGTAPMEGHFSSCYSSSIRCSAQRRAYRVRTINSVLGATAERALAKVLASWLPTTAVVATDTAVVAADVALYRHALPDARLVTEFAVVANLVGAKLEPPALATGVVEDHQQ
jgi:hypothetical protein